MQTKLLCSFSNMARFFPVLSGSTAGIHFNYKELGSWPSKLGFQWWLRWEAWCGQEERFMWQSGALWWQSWCLVHLHIFHSVTYATKCMLMAYLCSPHRVAVTQETDLLPPGELVEGECQQYRICILGTPGRVINVFREHQKKQLRLHTMWSWAQVSVWKEGYASPVETTRKYKVEQQEFIQKNEKKKNKKKEVISVGWIQPGKTPWRKDTAPSREINTTWDEMVL